MLCLIIQQLSWLEAAQDSAEHQTHGLSLPELNTLCVYNPPPFCNVTLNCYARFHEVKQTRSHTSLLWPEAAACSPSSVLC